MGNGKDFAAVQTLWSNSKTLVCFQCYFSHRPKTKHRSMKTTLCQPDPVKSLFLIPYYLSSISNTSSTPSSPLVFLCIHKYHSVSLWGHPHQMSIQFIIPWLGVHLLQWSFRKGVGLDCWAPKLAQVWSLTHLPSLYKAHTPYLPGTDFLRSCSWTAFPTGYLILCEIIISFSACSNT